MAPRHTYQDEKALDKLLDNLLHTAQSDSVGTSTALSFSSGNHLSESDITDKLAIANGLLQESKICSALPSLQPDDSNVKHVLSHALAAITHLCKCCKANSSLRREAERSVHGVNEELLRIKGLHEMKKDKISRLDTKIATMKKQATDAEKEKNRIVSGLTTECAQLKTKCARSTYRVNHLSLEVKKREREYSLLQQKVQTLMTSTKRLSIEPQIVAIAANNATKAPCISREKSLEREEKEYQELVGLSEHQCINEVIAENSALRDLLRAVQEELDDLLVSHPNLLNSSKTPGRSSGYEHSPMDGTKAVGNKFDGPSSAEENYLERETTADTETLSCVDKNSECQLQPSARCSAERRNHEEIHTNETERVCGEIMRDGGVGFCDGEQPKTPTDLKHDPESKSDETGDQSGSEGDNSHQVSCQDEGSKSPASIADAEVGTPVTGSSGRNGTVLNNLTPALSAEQMNLPFDMIRENLERSLDQKFELLRLAMQQVDNKRPNTAKE